MENTATAGYDFDDAEKFPKRLLIKGPCDLTVIDIAKECGWNDDLNALIGEPKPKENKEEEKVDQLA